MEYQSPVLIEVIVEIWVLKSERVLISESAEATPTNHFYAHATCVCAHIHGRGLVRT